ncbi:NAD(P)-dependent oxidoreductase [Desulfovibrio inopinatus]|uniref:NAD(P)-dependent oxidoreductase n=1 Tax=Desulfovibrio inopinatus TaxID=102109 RepID=UPI000414C1A5|nr:NAD(P)-dependent oxidoreductase [Desulfovibrio inopinatus]
MAKTLGFVGMGIMGLPMSLNLLRAGFQITVFNRTAERCQDAAEAGATVAPTPRALAEASDIIFLMLTGPEAVDMVVFGPDGAAQALTPSMTVVNMSTVSPGYTRKLASRIEATGARFVDAPVSGSKKPAEDGTLVILAGGEETDIAELQPMFDVMGKRTVHCGPASHGAAMKMSINLLLGTMMAGLAEMLHFGGKNGLDVDTMLDVVMSGPLANGLFQLKEPMLRTNEFPTQFPAKHMAKDLKFVVDTAYESGASAPCAHQVLQLFSKAVAQGLSEEDFAAVAKIF